MIRVGVVYAVRCPLGFDHVVVEQLVVGCVLYLIGYQNVAGQKGYSQEPCWKQKNDHS